MFLSSTCREFDHRLPSLSTVSLSTDIPRTSSVFIFPFLFFLLLKGFFSSLKGRRWGGGVLTRTEGLRTEGVVLYIGLHVCRVHDGKSNVFN